MLSPIPKYIQFWIIIIYIYIYLSEPRSNECFSSLLFSTILNYFSPFFFRGTTHKLSILLFFKNKQQRITTIPRFFSILFDICRVAYSFFFEPWQHCSTFFIMFDTPFIFTPPPHSRTPNTISQAAPLFALHQYSCLHYFWTIQRMYLTFTCNK